MIFAAIFIKLDDPKGPILFKQERPGKDEKIFKVYKFRTMKVDTKKDLSDMDRITRIGKILRKTSIDELPQIFNVIRGEMSFIGPRPLLVEYLAYYNKEQQRRHDVLPGISGWAQVNGRNAITWEEKFKLDIFYVENHSFALDTKIIFQTIGNILDSKNINESEKHTMIKFSEERRKVE